MRFGGLFFRNVDNFGLTDDDDDDGIIDLLTFSVDKGENNERKK